MVMAVRSYRALHTTSTTSRPCESLLTLLLLAHDLSPIPATRALRRARRCSRCLCGGGRGQLYFSCTLHGLECPCTRRPSRRGRLPGHTWEGDYGWVISSRPDHLHQSADFLFFTVTSPEKTLALRPRVPNYAGLSFVFPDLLPPSSLSSQHLGTTLFVIPNRIHKSMGLGPRNIP